MDLGPRAGDIVASFEDLVFSAASAIVFLGPQAPPLPPPPTPPPSTPPMVASPRHLGFVNNQGESGRVEGRSDVVPHEAAGGVSVDDSVSGMVPPQVSKLGGVIGSAGAPTRRGGARERAMTVGGSPPEHVGSSVASGASAVAFPSASDVRIE